MIDLFKKLTSDQFEAAYCALHAAIERCPETAWDAPVGNLAFCQLAFHTVFFSDYYLGPDEAALREQQFHRENPDFFRDYEELQPRRQRLLYDRPSIHSYLQHCRNKASTVIGDETAESLDAPCGFPPREFSRAELHVYNIRHVQHHAAQLSLRLRIDHGTDIPWFGSGWRDH